MMEQAIEIPHSELRDIETVTTEIRLLKSQAQRMALTYAVKIGRRLAEAKSMLPHGRWGAWLKEEVKFSQSTANNFMALFREYADDQITLEGAVLNSQALGNLSVTKALALLALPAEERESFAEANNIEQLPTREVERLVKEKKALEQKLEDAETERERLRQAHEAAREADRAAWEKEQAARHDEVERRAAKARAEANRLTDALQKAQSEAAALRDAALEAQKRAEQNAAAATEKARKMAEELYQKKLQKAEALQGKLQAAEAHAAGLEKKLRLAAPETALFQAEYARVQESYNRLIGLRNKIKLTDAETADKLTAALQAMLKRFKEEADT